MNALRGVLATMAGVGSGLVARKADDELKARQAKEDAWRDEQHGWERDKQAKAAKLDADLAAAAAPRATVDGTAVQGAGNRVFGQDPALAASMQQTLNDEAELRGMAPATSAPATGVVAQGAKVGHQIAAGPVDVAKMNAPEEVAGRVSQAYMANARPMEALTLKNTSDEMLARQRARIKELEKEGVGATMAALRANDPEGAMKAFQSAGSRKFPEGSKFVQVNGTDILTGKPGKVWSVQGADGAVLMPDVGAEAAKYLGIEGLIGRDDKLRAEGVAAEAAKFDREHKTEDLRIKRLHAEDDGAYKRGMVALYRDGVRGNGRGSAGTEQPAMPGPMDNFDSKRAYEVATKQATAELIDLQKPATPQEIAKRATSIYRGLEDEYRSTGIQSLGKQAFVQSAAKAKTPEEVAAVYQQGLEFGLAPAQMAAIDGRFKQPANPANTTDKAPTAAPAKAATPERAAPAHVVTTMGAMNPSGNADLARVLGPKATQIQGMAEMFRQSQAKTAAAAKSGDPRAVLAAAQEQQQIKTLIDKTLGDMSPQQAATVRSAAGIN